MKKKIISFIGLFVLGLCVISINGECKPGSVPCRIGEPKCVNEKQQNDGRIDCKDGSDEDCKEGWFICKDRTSCVDSSNVQDGVPDCADASDEECGPLQHRCVCAPHRCVDAENLKDGIKDCEDGSDEVEEIDIKSDCPKLVNSTNPVVRSKRRATDVSTRVDGPVTTSMFLGADNLAIDSATRTRPTGLLTSTVGTFIQQGTTTEFATKVFGTHVDGHYAKIISTSSRVFFAIPSPAAGDALGGVRPTGLISSVTATRVSGLATTLHTTDYYRTYIDGTYAQLVSSYSRVVYPSTHTILATNAYNSIQSGQIYQTALNVLNEAERHNIDVSPINSKPIDKIIASKASTLIKPSGSYKSAEHVTVVTGDTKISPAAMHEDVVTITGTHAAFVNSPIGNAETTYNVFTGTYIRDSKTYHFFFGNSADHYNPSSINVVHATSIPEPQELIIKSAAIPGKRIVVNVDRELNLVVPKQAASHAVAGTGEIEGQDLGGVFIEASDDLSGFSVHGAQRSRNNVATEMLTVTIGKNVAHTKILRDHSLQPTAVKSNDKTVFKFLPQKDRLRQSSSSRVTSSSSHHVEEENENLLKARKIDYLRPTKPKINLPTYTVGHIDYEHGIPSSHEDTTEVTISVNKSVEAFIGNRPRKDFKFLSTSNRPRPGKSFRNFQIIHDKEDLQHVESQHATVTYVGFADFTTTVGNTVIVFMPHTKSSQQPKSISPNLKVTKLSDAILPTVSSQHLPESTRMMTKIKTYFSNSPGMVTKTVTGHTLKMQTSLPTMLVSATRKEKEFNINSFANEKESDYEDMRSKVLAEEQVEASHVIDAELSSELHLTSIEIEPSVAFEDGFSEVIASSADVESHSSIEFESIKPEISDISSVIQTPQLTFATTETKLYNTDSQFPIGLVKSVGGTEAFNGTTTIFTSLFYGTRIEGKYAQIIQTTSSIYFKDNIDPTKSLNVPVTEITITTEESVQSTTESSTDTTTEGTTVELLGTTVADSSAENELVNEVDLGRKVNSNPNDQVIEDNLSMSSILAKGAPQVPAEETSTIQYVTKVIPNTVYKTYTYLTTFFIPDGEKTSTSVQSREVTSSEINLSTSLVDIREILATAVANLPQPSTTPQSIESETTEETTITTNNITPETSPSDVTINEIVTFPTTPIPDTVQEEIELIFKTQYTTYTYLTTYFHEKSSSVSSREEVVTNIITSTIDPGSIASDPAVAGLFAREDSIVSAPLEIMPTSVGVGRPTTKFFSEMDESAIQPTARLAPSNTESFTILDHPENEIKTYYTTYTYFTTIFVDGETTISSRTEVYTNIITPTGVPNSPTQNLIATTLLPENLNVPLVKDEEVVATKTAKAIESGNYANKYSTAIRHKLQQELSDDSNDITTPKNAITTPDLITASSNTQTMAEISEVTTEASTAETSTESSNHILITQEIPSGPTGPSGLEDQISLESNTDIDPSPTLLLQTSYTTFTYFTTLYKGTTSEIISRLETVTNVATETVTPVSASVLPVASIENNELDATSVQELYPITYFTTFTYWTTAYKDGSTVVTSREETVSNVVTPTAEVSETSVSVSIVPEASSIVVTPTPVLEQQPTTFYTTFTYFTTSYIGDSTVINSRLETVTKIATNTQEDNIVQPSQTGRAIGTAAPSEQLLESPTQVPVASPILLPTGLISTIRSTTVNDGTTTLLSTDVYGTYIDGLYAKVLESSTQVITEVTPSPSVAVQPTGVVSLNIGSIVDVEGITTTYYTTKAIGTYIGNLYAQVVESTTSLYVDPERTPEPAVPSRTGLVRLIEGSIEKDGVTTIYESRVIGTVVDGKYAQIIESTSNYQTAISPTSTASGSIEETQLVSGTIPVLESSIGDTTGSEDDQLEEHEEGDELDEDDEDDPSAAGGKGRVKSRLTFQSRKRTFTPVIRPFASRNRPTFNPRRRQTSATTITRTTLTPTVTATPASVSGGETVPFSRGRFNNRRVTSSASPAQSNNAEVRPTSVRKFSRGRSSSTAGYAPASSSGYSSISGRRSSSGRISPTQASAYPFGSSSRRGGSFSGRNAFSTSGRGSSAHDNQSSKGSSTLSGSSRFRIRPTSSLSYLGRPTPTLTPSTPDLNDNVLRDIDNDVTEIRTEQEGQNTDFTDTTLNENPTTVTEATNFKRPPPFKLRRPPIPTRAPTTSTTGSPRTTSAARRFSLRRPTASRNSDDDKPDERKTERPKFRASTTTPVPARARVTRPNGAQTLRQRPTSNLFPPRGLFRRPGDEEDKGEDASKTEEDKLVDEQNQEDKPAHEDEIGDNDYEASEPIEKSVQKKETPKIQIRPFQSRLLRRSRRQSEYGNRGGSPSRTLASRLRRPSTVRKTPVVEEEVEDYEHEEVTPAPKYSPRSRSQQTVSAPRVRPSAASPRSQFTLTNSNSRSSQSINKRPTTNTPATSRRRRPESVTAASRISTPQRPKPPRLRTQNSETTTNRGSNSRRFNTATTNRGRTTSSRGRYRDFDYADTPYSQSTFDGTITVTHKVPTEVTIPVVNGKITEYKQVIRNTPSTEILRPDQYSSTEISGSAVLIINTEITATPTPGITEVTQFILRETPTTSVTFTPTNIRGRKTSFSHIVPSTVYEVENVINTISDSLNPSAPLANLLLSQLLLGNFGLPQNINPLLALNQQAAPATPVTEYKTRSTTYVTTVTDLKSKVLPLTLRGKAITTTIIESSVDVITATEYITDTIVVTPTQSTNNQINSLLLPALLQAQLAGQQQQSQNANPLLQFQQAQQLQQLQQQQLNGNKASQKNKASNKETFEEDLEDTYHDDDPRSTRDSDFDVISKEEISQPNTKYQPTVRKKQKIQPIAPKPKETSIITLYVSGRKPGEFSTVLSTVISDSGASLVKREAITPADIELKPSAYQKITMPQEDIDLYIMSAMNDIEGSESGSSSQETQSLESILGDVTKHIDQSITVSNNDLAPAASLSNNVQTGHFLSQGSVELAPLIRKARSTQNRGHVDTLTSLIDENITPRKRIRIRVPIRKTKSEDLTLAEAQHPGFSENKNSNDYAFLTKKTFVLTAGKSPILVEHTNTTLQRKRVIITRRKKITETVTNFEQTKSKVGHLPAPSSRKLKVVTHKRPVITASIKPTATRQRIVITKKRLINKPLTIEESPRIYSSMVDLSLITSKKSSMSKSIEETIMPSSKLEKKHFSQFENDNIHNDTIEIKQSIENSKTTPTKKTALHIVSSNSYSDPILSDILSTTLQLEPSLHNSITTEKNKSSEHATPTLSETYIEETTYDGPKFVRPTRFSVTHKPSDAFLKRIQSLRTKGKSVLPTRSYNRNVIKSTTNTVNDKLVNITQRTNSINNFYISKTLDAITLKSNSPPKESIVHKNEDVHSTKVEVYILRTETQTKLKTFTFIITRVNGEEKLVTTTHEVKPVLTTVTLTDTLHPSSASAVVISTPVVSFGETNPKDESLNAGRGISGRVKFEEGRMNLATRIMNNGVEVIVADRSTLTNENLRIAPSAQRPLLAPSTLSDHMLSLLPENNPQGSLIASLRSKTAQFITKSNPTTFTYVTTLKKGRNTITSSREEVIYNRVTEPPSEEFISPSKTIDHYTITSNYDKPKYETSTIHTTYTYLNTILDGEVPVVVTSKETISNTITGQLAYNQLYPSEPVFDTNTYYNTFTFTKSLNDENGSKFTSKHRNIVTQVVITEAPTFTLKPSSSLKQTLRPTATTDIVKTYFVTYTYFSTFLEKGSTVIKTNIATSSDIVTEKFYLSPKRTSVPENTKIFAEIDIAPTSYEPLNVFATKTYLTTFTYFTTLLQGKNTVTSSSTKLVYNVVTEAITSGLDSLYLDSLRSSFAAQTLREPITTTVMLAGEALEITAVQPTAAIGNILNTASSNLSPSFEHVVTGSTIIFLEDETTTATNAYTTTTKEPEVAHVYTGASTIFFSDEKNKNNTDTPEFLLSSLESNSATTSQTEFLTSTISASTVIKNSNGPATTLLPGDKVVLLTRPDGNVTMIPVSDPVKKRPIDNDDEEEDEDDADESEDGDLKVPSLTGSDGSIAAEIGVSDLLNFGQLGINGLNALGPVINAMAGLIQSNLNTGQVKRNITQLQIRKPSTPFPEYIQPKTPNNKPQISAQREPVYIPVGSLANNAHLTSEKHVPGFAESVRPDLPEDNENAGSSWVDSLPLQGIVGERIPLMDRPPQSQIVLGRPTMESPLLQDGIPIQPGQVITANSDVIVGKPSVLGPRPRPTNQVIPPNDLRHQQIRPNEELHHQHNINDIHSQQNQHNYQTKPNIPKIVPGKISSSSNVPIGMRPPPLPQPHQQHQPHHIPHKSTSNTPSFLGNRFPQTHLNQASSHHHQGSHNYKPIPHPTFVQNGIERSTGTIRPSKPLIIQGASTQYFGSDGRPINNDFSNEDRSPIPLPEPGFIGVSNIGVSDQHIHVNDNNDGHIVVGTVGEPPAGPQHLGEVILEIPDTMPVLQPGSKLNFPVSSEQDNGGVGLNLEGLALRPIHEQNHGSNLHRPALEFTHAGGQLNRPHIDSHIAHRPAYEHSGRPVYRPQVDNFNIKVQQSVPVQNPTHDKNPAFSRPPFDNQRNPNHPNLQQTPIDMMPPPLPNRIDPSNNLPQRPLVHYVTQHSSNNYQENLPQQQRPHQSSGPVVIPFNQHRPLDHNLRPDDVVISPVNNWEDPDEPEIQEGEEQGEVIQESNDRPLRPNEIPPEIVTERPHISDFNNDEDIVTQRPHFTRDRVTHGPDSSIQSERPTFSNNRIPFNRPENDIITRRPTITINNQGIVVSERAPDIVTARPTISSHNPIFTKHEEAADTERPTFIINSDGFEYDSQANTPRPFISRPPRPPTSEKPPPLPMPDQDMNPPPPPVSSNQNKSPVPPSSSKNQQRFPIIEVNLQDSTHRPTIGQRPQRPKPSSPYQYEIPERDVKPPPLPSLQRPSPFKPPPFAKDRIPDAGPSESLIIVPQGTVETVQEERLPQRPTLRPRPARPSPRPSVRPTRPSSNLSSRPIRLPPQFVLEPPSPPPNVDLESSILTEPSIQTIASIEGDNIIVRTNTFEDSTIRPTKTVTVFETILTDSLQTQKYSPTRSSYKPKTRPPFRRPVSSSNIQIESSQEVWPETTKVRHTTSIIDSIETASTNTVEPTKSVVILGAGIFARPKPSNSVKQYSSVFRNTYDNFDSDPVTTVVTLPQSPTTRFVTHTETYTVTSTETTVLRSRGHPITRTVILTQTEAPRTVVSTIIGTITEIHTLDPSTITTTISATVTTREVEVTTTIYPPISPLDYNDYPAFTVRPVDSLPPKQVDEFVEESDRNPHGHDHDEELVRGVELENEVNRAVENNAADLPFSVDQPPSVPATCQPECDVNKSELCQERDGNLRCICRPGFARTFPDTPCTPTYTYRLKLLLDKEGPRRLRFMPTLSDASSPEFRRLSDATREGVMRAAMRSELRDMFHGAAVTGFEPKQKPKEANDLDQADDLMLNFYLQLSENMDESVLEEKFQRSLQSTNYSLGGTEVFAARETGIQAFDFDECGSPDFNDCSEHAQCFNLRGTYTCSCNEGYSDLSPSSKFPGRSCSAELLGCEQCNFHGTCYTLGRGDDKQYCDCFQWYAGDNCNINLKALLIALVTLGAVMLMLLLVCLILTCLKKRRNNKEGPGPGFMRYRGPGGAQVRGTLDKAAMLQDTSSESSGTTSPLPYMTPVHASGSKGGRRGVNMDPSMVVHGEGSYVVEQDRSLTVMIPRAKYRPVPPASSVLSMSTFAAPDATRTSGGGSPGNQSEQKLINYLETGPQEKQSSGGKRKQSSSSANHPENSRKTSAPRRPSAGALVSAGFEVSAQVTRPNARRASQGDHLTLASHRSGFTTLRTGDSDIERTPQSMEDLSPATIPIPPPPPPVTVSEARSYDETLVQPPTRSLVMRGAHLQPSSTYGSKLGSSRNDGQTMAERDIGSTFVMPQSQLYKPTRGQGSDVSNFDSL